MASTSANGGSTAFSSATDTASITVNAVNDAPVVTSINPLIVPENASNGTILGTLTATDVDGNTTFSNWAIASGNLPLGATRFGEVGQKGAIAKSFYQ